jgi:pimeloyl-ACP methyl ester carboxylesterase
MRRRFVLPLALLSVALASACAASASTSAITAKKPKPLQMRDSCVRGSLRKRVVRFSAPDRVRLIGIELGTGPRGVVLGHQGASDLCIWLPHARRLAAAGYRVLALDFRRNGSSSYPEALRKLWRIDLDIHGAVALLRRHGARSVVIAGASLGAAAVDVAAANIQRPVDGVVSLSGPTSFVNLDVLGAAARIRVPALFMAEEGDGEFPNDARALYAAAPSTDKRLEILPGTAHGVFMFQGPGSATAWGLFTDFVRAHSVQ